MLKATVHWLVSLVTFYILTVGAIQLPIRGQSRSINSVSCQGIMAGGGENQQGPPLIMWTGILLECIISMRFES